MNVNEMMGYEAPQVEVIEVEVEKGFATSTGTDPNDPMSPEIGA